MEKSMPLTGDRPDWYVGLPTKAFGDYYGSTASLSVDETYLTYDKRFIVHHSTTGEITVCMNACAHAGAPLLTTPGVQDTQRLVCPIHKWAFKPTGELIGAPYFHKCQHVSLSQPEFGVWNGYILGYDPEELHHALSGFGKKLGITEDTFNPNEFVFMGEEIYELPYPRQLMYVNYFDGLHVPLYHKKTFDAVADAETYAWEFSTHKSRVGYSLQQVMVRNDVRARFDALLRKHDCVPERFGWADFHVWLETVMPNAHTPIDRDVFAIWAAIYGNGYLMPELYEGGRFLAVSYLVNSNPRNLLTGNKNLVEYYVHRSVPEKYRKTAFRRFVHAYEQSAREDDEICLKLWEAHRLGGLEFERIYHEVLEAGDVHWRKWFMEHFRDGSGSL